jgi:hypothetical protein
MPTGCLTVMKATFANHSAHRLGRHDLLADQLRGRRPRIHGEPRGAELEDRNESEEPKRGSVHRHRSGDTCEPFLPAASIVAVGPDEGPDHRSMSEPLKDGTPQCGQTASTQRHRLNEQPVAPRIQRPVDEHQRLATRSPTSPSAQPGGRAAVDRLHHPLPPRRMGAKRQRHQPCWKHNAGCN